MSDSRRALLVVCFALVCSVRSATAQSTPLDASASASASFEVKRHVGDAVVLSHRAAQLARRTEHGRFAIERLPIAPNRAVDVELRRFRIADERTRFVLGRLNGPDRPLEFDPESVMLLRGRVLDQPNSRVYLALTANSGVGMLDLGQGERFRLLGNGGSRTQLAPGELIVSAAPRGGILHPHVQPCGLPDGPDEIPGGHGSVTPLRERAEPPAPEMSSSRGAAPSLGRKQIELAVETDYELYALFGNDPDTLTYLMQMYGAVSDIFMRDVNASVTLSYVRIWDDPADLFNEVDPLGEFRNYWEASMTGVHRDVAQFCSGRVNFPYGGVAYLNGLCNDRSYSVTGYNLGATVTPDTPPWFTRDIAINAHELGHNCGARHTHNYGLDLCDQPIGPAQRGTIMAYCGQTRSGGDANRDLRFHSFVQGEMESYFDTRGCLATDCDGNGVSDPNDIAGGAADINGNGVPDVCEDCNDNGALDEDDIAGGAADVNANGIPDVCEPDCDKNELPDDFDIASGADDLNNNNILDECEADCDGDMTADYLQIQADMSLDLDRDAQLDACQDCDGDSTPDLVELDGASNIWIATTASPRVVREFHAVTGAMVRESTSGAVDVANDLMIDDAGRIFVSSVDGRVVEFDRTGSAVGDLVGAGAGGLVEPAGLVVGPNGNLFVADRGADTVREYNRATGASLGAFVLAGSGGLTQPFGLTFGPNGNLFVTSNDNRVLEFDGATGALIGDHVTAADNGGLLDPRGIVFMPDGRLLVASRATNQVLEYAWPSGAFIRQFNDGGSADRLTLDEPWGLRVGFDGDVYVIRHGTFGGQPAEPGHLHLTEARIYQFDGITGRWLRAVVIGNDTGLDDPTGFDFMPNDGVDCNFNMIQDSCDLASGFSVDGNGNGIPDECECPGDVTGDGSVDISDLGAVLSQFGATGSGLNGDLDGDGDVDITDLGLVLANFGLPCG